MRRYAVMNLIKCYQTNSNWYKGAFKNSTPIGILWHDTGAGNPKLSRYVQPLETDDNYDEMIALLGKNKYNNDQNHKSGSTGVNAWIGKLADGSIGTVQAGEWTTVSWGCGKGSKGSCNGYYPGTNGNVYQGRHWIQFEICDDGYNDEQYFHSIYKEACELTAYLCELFNIDPNGTVEFNGVTVPTILCHADAYQLKLGSNHGDVLRWFKKYGYNMDLVRSDVTTLLKRNQPEEPTIISNFNLLDEVKIKDDVKTWYNGKSIASWVYSKTLYVRKVNGNLITVSTLQEGAVTGTVYDNDLILIKKASSNSEIEEEVKKPIIEEEVEVIPPEEPSIEVIPSEPEIEEPKQEEVPNEPSIEPEVDPPLIEDEKDKEEPKEEVKEPEEPTLFTEEEKKTLSQKFFDFLQYLISLIIKGFKK